MWLLFFPILGCKAHEGAGGGGLSNFAPSWMTGFQRGPETAGTLYGLPSPSPPTPTGPPATPSGPPVQPSDPQPSTTPQPSDPTGPPPSGLDASQPPATPAASQPPATPAASQPPATPAASLPLSLPRSLGPPERSTSPDITAPQDCERAYCHHHKSEHIHEPIHGPLTQPMFNMP
nr:PREDICTED: vegetative cell wall protein gp1-like [Daucus carota subsp. sativus]